MDHYALKAATKHARRLIRRVHASVAPGDTLPLVGPARGRGPTRCRHCQEDFSSAVSPVELKIHEKGCGTRSCQHCCEEFGTPLQCRGHETLCQHNSDLRCQFCNARFPSTLVKRSHEALCEANPALWCDFCGARFPHTALKDRHEQRCPKHPDRGCSFCTKRFPSRAEAMMHRISCPRNPKSVFTASECAACCDSAQCIVFPCGVHRYCAACLFRMARDALNDRAQLPLHCCRRSVRPGDAVDLVVAQMLSETDRRKYQEAMLLKTAKHVMYCPRLDCGALIVLDGVVGAGLPALDASFGCPSCQQALCSGCKSEWHVGMTCKQYKFMSSRSRDEFTKYCRAMKWMICYDCGHVIEKKAGCDHITCFCGAQFCYICGTKWGECECHIFSQGHALRHNRIPALGEQHACQFCRQVYPSRDELQTHLGVCRLALEQAGMGFGALECESCLQRFVSGDELRRHRRRECRFARITRGPRYGCPVCGEMFILDTELRRHRRSCTEG